MISHLECGLCGERHDAGALHNLSSCCARPLLARYDLGRARRDIDRDEHRDVNREDRGGDSGSAHVGRDGRRAQNVWRFPGLMPVADASHRITLGEGWTPLVHAQRLGAELRHEGILIKDEGGNPTGSFKARGMAAAVSRARELGVTAVSVPSAGNAAGAMSAYAAKAGLEAHVYMPRDVPAPFVVECETLGAHVTLIDGLITDCGREAAKDVERFGRFDLSTLKEPYRLEGKKTMGYEIAEQLDWSLPDVIVYPTGGGTGLVGMWKAFDEMESLGWIGPKRPRMVSVQAAGCAPVVRAYERGDEFAEPWANAQTLADGLRVPAAVGDFLMLRALRESDGTAIAVTDAEMLDGARLMGRTEGIFGAPEGGAAVAAARRLMSDGWIASTDTVVLFNTGSGHKYADRMR